ncbi:MAG: hypothetical protein M1826_003390 [Phylliscum demangeonii]|nr:MAG: hypothetical protein M1826_003390 [Phylliscum demangeonii]
MVFSHPIRLTLPVPGRKSFETSFNYNSRLASPAIEFILSCGSHPMRPKVLRDHEARDPNRLWWDAVAYKNVHYRAVLRNYCKRRMSHAFLAALQANGYDRFGTRLDVDGASGAPGDSQSAAPAAARRPRQGMTGSLLLKATDVTLTDKYDVLLEHAQRLVAMLEHVAMGRPPRHSIARAAASSSAPKRERGAQTRSLHAQPPPSGQGPRVVYQSSWMRPS